MLQMECIKVFEGWKGTACWCWCLCNPSSRIYYSYLFLLFHLYRCVFGAVDFSWQTFERWRSFWLHAYIWPTYAEISSLLTALVIIILIITLCFPAPNFTKVVVILFVQTVKIRNLFAAQMRLVSISDSDTNVSFTEGKHSIHCKQR